MVSIDCNFRETIAHYGPSSWLDLIDTVHFAQSHHSRMLQLADVCMWYRQLIYRTDVPTSLREDFLIFCRELDIGMPNTYKFWPT